MRQQDFGFQPLKLHCSAATKSWSFLNYNGTIQVCFVTGAVPLSFNQFLSSRVMSVGNLGKTGKYNIIILSYKDSMIFFPAEHVLFLSTYVLSL